jgi:hypothetical protein
VNRRSSSLPIVVAALVASTVTGVAHADPKFGPNDIRSLFAIKKSENRNEVHYGVHLDESCQPIGDEPIFGYWQQLEEGPNVVLDLNILDRKGYGIKGQWIQKRTPEESKLLMSLKATPERGIAITVKKKDGKCVAETVTTINKESAFLENVFVHIAGFLSVDWIELRGLRLGKPTVERVKR